MTQTITRPRPRVHTPPTGNTRTRFRATKAARRARRFRRTFPRRPAGVPSAASPSAVIVLAVCFVVVTIARLLHAHSVARAGETAYAAPPPVDVVIARPASAGQDLVLPGQTAAWYETTIYARVNGYVAKWLVDIGDHVDKGQVLATIETPELDAELAAARAQLQVIGSPGECAQGRGGIQQDHQRALARFPEGRRIGTGARVEEGGLRSPRRRDCMRPMHRSPSTNPKSINIRALAEFKQVKAPFDGTITERKIDVGNLVTAGSGSTTTPMYRMAQTDPLRVFVDVPQSAAGELMNSGVPATDTCRRRRGRCLCGENRAIRGIHQPPGAHHARRGRYAECQSQTRTGNVRHRGVPPSAARIGGGAGRGADLPLHRNPGGAGG